MSLSYDQIGAKVVSIMTRAGDMLMLVQFQWLWAQARPFTFEKHILAIILDPDKKEYP